MMKLYIANTTKQIHKFTFRLPEMKHNKIVEITYGDQMMVHNGSSDEVDSIITHHAIYGLTEAKRIDQNQQYIGLCYSIDKPVPASVIENAMRDNDDKLNANSYNRRQASLAAHDESLKNNGNGYGGSMEFSADQTKGRDDRDDTPTVNEKISTRKRSEKN